MQNRDDYGTPLELYQELYKRFHFKLDPCAWPENKLNTPYFYTEEVNGLNKLWGPGPVFMNPPYSNPTPWCAKAFETAKRGTLVVGLLRHDPSTQWWNKWIKNKALVIPIPYRLHFINHETGEPEGAYNFPSAIVIWTGLFL